MSISKPVTYPIIHPVADALREAGFIPLPRLWIHGDAMPELKRLTDRYRDEVNEIRGQVRAGLDPVNFADLPDYGPLPFAEEAYDERGF